MSATIAKKFIQKTFCSIFTVFTVSTTVLMVDWSNCPPLWSNRFPHHSVHCLRLTRQPWSPPPLLLLPHQDEFLFTLLFLLFFFVFVLLSTS